MIYFRGATAWEMAIGRLWVRIHFPRYWLYSRARSVFFRHHRFALAGPQRGWLYAWPGAIGWERRVRQEKCLVPGCDNITDCGICDDCDVWVSEEVAKL